jgi:carbonic anhydrase/acetyltransferase-like protein (isoleucine patch superfamily)
MDVPTNIQTLSINTSIMALIKTLNGITPVFGKDCYLAENSTVIGDVVMGDQCSIWFNAVIRGDVNSIRIGNKVNIQDGAMIHCTYQKTKTVIGNNVSVGHHAIIHGCELQDDVLVGMGAIIMDNCVVGSNSIIAAGAVLLENTRVEPGSIYAGIPAKKVKSVSEEKVKGEINRIADNYVLYSAWYK